MSQIVKSVMIIDEALPLGLIANTGAVLGMTLGKAQPHIVGPDVTDKTQRTHLGITEFPVPILKGSRELLIQLREKLYQDEFSSLTVIDFCDTAQRCTDYADYTRKMAVTDNSDLAYLGLCISGDKKLVNKLTGSLGLLR